MESDHCRSFLTLRFLRSSGRWSRFLHMLRSVKSLASTPLVQLSNTHCGFLRLQMVEAERLAAGVRLSFWQTDQPQRRRRTSVFMATPERHSASLSEVCSKRRRQLLSLPSVSLKFRRKVEAL